MSDSETVREGLRAVIFDMDGVLCSTDELHYQSWEQAVCGYDIPFDREINHKLRGLTRSASLDALLGGRPLSQGNRQAILETKNQIYIGLLESIGPDSLLPGVMSLLLELREGGYRIGVASASQHVDRILNRLQISGFIQATCNGSLIQHSKPAPDPYLYVAGQLGVSPRYCLAIEDSQAGIVSAITAGMCVIGLGDAAKDACPSAYFDNLQNVRAAQLQKIYTLWAGRNSQDISLRNR